MESPGCPVPPTCRFTRLRGLKCAKPSLDGFTYTAVVNGQDTTQSTPGSADFPDATLRVVAAPAQPAGFSATDGTGEVTLAWDDPGDDTITKYQYQQKEGDASFGGWNDILDSAAGGANATSYTVAGLTPGTTYTFKLDFAQKLDKL